MSVPSQLTGLVIVQYEVVCTYKAGANWIGKPIGLETHVRHAGQSALLLTSQGAIYTAKADATLIDKIDMSGISSTEPAPTSVDLTVYATAEIANAPNPVLSPTPHLRILDVDRDETDPT